MSETLPKFAGVTPKAAPSGMTPGLYMWDAHSGVYHPIEARHEAFYLSHAPASPYILCRFT